MKDSTTAIFTSMTAALESRHFLATLGMDKEEMTAWIRRNHLRALADELQGCRDEDGRFLSPCRHRSWRQRSRTWIAFARNRPEVG